MYKKMASLLLVLVFAVSMLTTVPVLGAGAQNVVSIDVAHTKDLYAMSETSKVVITGVTENGETVTEFGAVDYFVDYPVVTVSEDGTITPIAAGYAVLTVTVTNPDGSKVSDKILLTVYSSRTTYSFEANGSFNITDPEKNHHLKFETNNPRNGSRAAKVKYTTEAVTIHTNKGIDLSLSNGKDQATVSTGWFYDTGAKEGVSDSTGDTLMPGTVYFQGYNNIKNSVNYSMITLYVGVKALEDDYYYVQNVDKSANRKNILPGLEQVKGVEGKEGTGYIGEPDKAGTFYTDGEDMPLIERTKGWHQVSVVIDMGKEGAANIGTDNGSTKVFLDGELIFEEQYVPNGFSTIRGHAPGFDNKNNPMRGAFGLYDDLFSALIGNTDRIPYVQVKYSVGANGSVKVGNTAKTDGQKELIVAGSDVTLTLIPDEGYEAKVAVNGVDAEVSNNQVIVENIQENTEIAVSFEPLATEEEIILPDPDSSLTENVIDAYLPKNGLSTELAKYSFDTQADVDAWTLGDTDGKVDGATKSMGTGANGTAGSIMQTADGKDKRPRIFGPDAISWNRGSTYTITAWLKGDSEFEISPWLNTDATISTSVGSGTYLAYGRKKLTTNWQEYTWEFKINNIVQKNESISTLPMEFYIRMAGDNPAHTFWMDELVIKETIPGYTKLGLMAETTQLLPNETADLTVVGNNGNRNYKVAKEGMTFVSSDETIATVDANGVVTAKAAGQVRIGVTDGDYTGTIDMTVENGVQVKYSIGENGSVKVGNADKVNNQVDQIVAGEDVTLTLIPDEGYKAKVTVNGVDAPVSASNEVIVENIQENTEIAVSFELIPVTPSISGSDADYIIKEDNYYNNQPAYVAYYKVTVPSNATLGEYGMYFNEEDGAKENEIRLVAKGKNDMNMFGIRVFGAAVTADKKYSFKGFAVIDNQEYTD